MTIIIIIIINFSVQTNKNLKANKSYIIVTNCTKKSNILTH